MSKAVPLILDASVLINFLNVDRLEPLATALPFRLTVTQHVGLEIRTEYGEQLARFRHAMKAEWLTEMRIDDLIVQAEIVKFAADARVGLGESSAIVLASRMSSPVAIDDNRAIRKGLELCPMLEVFRTEDLVVQLIRAGALTAQEADALKELWRTQHRFALKVRSFADLLGTPSTRPPAPTRRPKRP
ncbi:MAG: hypothetical protein IT349_09025 [Candidatus Eisenbacteria bacterium]|nr:hypothetical protein [Candidatus Eisenbacteria bacterium]